MRFRLIYEGLLPANSRTAANKSAIRRAIHPQLNQLLRTQPVFADFRKLTHHFDPKERGGVDFIAIGPKSLNIHFELSILLLTAPSNERRVLLQGDLDNRVKTIIDGLRMPNQKNEIDDKYPRDCPTVVLMDDDSQVVKVEAVADIL